VLFLEQVPFDDQLADFHGLRVIQPATSRPTATLALP
jgi:hypothetical protein